MTQPIFLHRRPEVIQAIQYTGDNLDAILAFLKVRNLSYFQFIENGMWVCRDAEGNEYLSYDDDIRKHYIQQNETL